MTHGHPCFDEEAHLRVGRVHLAVAPLCNIQCGFCDHRVCAGITMQHPGWAQRLLSPVEALERVRLLAAKQPGSFVVGVAGPGDPLANPETFEVLRAVRKEYPSFLRCLSTNGLLLEEKTPELAALGVTHVSVTVNAVDGQVGEAIYGWVRHRGMVSRGREAAELLIARQLQGIRAAVRTGLTLKVNTVLIPGVNDAHLLELARRVREAGVRLLNIMPLIPGGQMRSGRPPTPDELRRARLACGKVIRQFRHCEQCSADTVRFPASSIVPACQLR